MKFDKFSGTLLIALVWILFCSSGVKAQMVNEVAKKRVTIGVGLFEDIWFGIPKGINTRTINQGFQTFAMYNVPFGKSNFGFSIGLGFRAQNMYGNFLVKSTQDSTWLEKIGDTASVNYQRSKLTLPYLELPLEFRFKSKSKIAVGIGFKVAYLLPAHSKYVGENYETLTGEKYRVKYREIKNLEQFSYGPTFRIGYRWFHINAYYSLSKIFTKGNGPEIYPLSIGILLMPF
ncbi:MAG: outer membrane beta-barrel protein [Bacteroidales bacterium]|nr:outer membrane beta-barrel protein [Bacteroidales bacterium]